MLFRTPHIISTRIPVLIYGAGSAGSHAGRGAARRPALPPRRQQYGN